MGKLFRHRMTITGWGAIAEATKVATRAMKNAEEIYGHNSIETANSSLVLASPCFINEDYRQAEQCFQRYVDIMSRERGAESTEVFHGLAYLMNTYRASGDRSKHDSVSERVFRLQKSFAKSPGLLTDNDPLIEVLYDFAISGREGGDGIDHRQAFVFALMALSWCVTAYGSWQSVRIRMIRRLRELIMSFGINRHGYAWLLLYSNQNETDFVVLLSVIDEEGVFPLKGFELEPIPEPVEI